MWSTPHTYTHTHMNVHATQVCPAASLPTPHTTHLHPFSVPFICIYCTPIGCMAQLKPWPETAVRLSRPALCSDSHCPERGRRVAQQDSRRGHVAATGQWAGSTGAHLAGSRAVRLAEQEQWRWLPPAQPPSHRWHPKAQVSEPPLENRPSWEAARGQDEGTSREDSRASGK